jgi:hypothetical protein
MLIPRDVVFGKDGKAITAGVAAAHYSGPDYIHKTMFLPSEHYDFIDYDVRGKTVKEIERDCGCT